MFHNIKCNYTDKYVMSLFNKKKIELFWKWLWKKEKEKTLGFRIFLYST